MKKNNEYSVFDVYKKMMIYVNKHKMYLFLYLLFSVIGIVFNLLLANLINTSIESAINNKQEILKECVFQAIILLLVGTGVTFISSYVYNRFKTGVMLDIRNDATEHLQNLPLSIIENNHTGEFISRYTNDMMVLQNLIGTDIINIIITCLQFLLTSTYLISINWQLFLVSTILIPPVLYFSTKISKPIGEHFKEAYDNIAKANSIAKDSYSGIFILKSFNLQNLFFEKFSYYIEKSIESSFKAINILKWMPPFYIILYSSPFTICLIYGSYLATNNEISPGQLPVFVFLLNFIVWPISAIINSIGSIRTSLGISQRFFEILDIKTERKDGEYFKDIYYKNCIVFKDVTYSYENELFDEENSIEENKTILKNFNMIVKKGSITALVGPSGCGKSTVLKLIMGFYSTKKGKLYVYGHNINDWNINFLRSKISFVSQDTYLFPSSIYENILCARINASMEDVIEAAKFANAHEFIMGLPNGYRTIIGESGIKLSGGQKQRISIARAFLRNADIILFDEPTSSLDTISESMIQNSIERLMDGKTALIVAHRFSTIKTSDQIFVMDNGQIIETGTHEELFCKDNLYSKLYKRQVGDCP